MTNEVNRARIDFTLKNGEKVSRELQFTNAQLIINDAVILQVFPDAKNLNIDACHIVLGVNNIAVNINKYTLTDKLFFASSYDMPSNISIFQSKGTNVHIVNQKVDLMQLDCQSILLANCQIRQLDIGLAEHSKALRESSNSNDNSVPTAYKMESIDLRECQITFVSAYIECNYINVRGSIINTFFLHGGFGSKVVAEVNKLNLFQYNIISVLEINCKILELIIKESTIYNMVARAHCNLDKLSTDDSTVLNAYKFEKEYFKQLNFTAWMLISKSADNDKKLNIRAEADYQMAKENYKKENGFNILFDYCTGYGYKPIRALYSCIVLVTASFLTLTLKDYIYLRCAAINNFLNNAIISIAAIAGQSGLCWNKGFNFWIATAEYIGGIIIFAMFVNALYVRYKN
jgi:hypothetical protein